MKKLICSAVLAVAGSVLLTGAALAQTIRRVNTLGVSGTNIYTTAQAAYNAAASGDIIYIETGVASAGDLDCNQSKTGITIIGNGYFAENAGLRASGYVSQLGRVTFRTGSANCRITGCTTLDIQVEASNVTIERNNVTSGVELNAGTGAISGVVVRSNYIENGSYGSGIYFNRSGTSGIVNGGVVTNNIVRGPIYATQSYGPIGMANCIIENNVIGGDLTVDGSIVRNNILTQANGAFSIRNNSQITNNISAGTQFGTANGNKANVNMTTVFTTYPASIDSHYVLALNGAANPARGAANGGGDCGAFGVNTGNTYVLSGIAPVPTIYQYSQTLSGNTLNVTISTKSNK